MAWINPKLIAKGKDLLLHGHDQLRMAPSWKVSPAHRPGKQGVTREHCAWGVKTNTPRRVARCMDNPNGVGPHLEVLTIIKMTISRKTEAGFIKRMNPDRRPCYSFQLFCAPRMVKMPMGNKDVFYCNTQLGNLTHNSKYLVPRIDHQSFQCVLAAKDITICLVGSYW